MEAEARSTSLRNELGFSLIEALIAMLITLVVLAAAFGAFKSMADVNATSVRSMEVTQNLQSSLTMIRRDLQRTGQGVPDVGISVPSGTTYTNNTIFGLEPGTNRISVMYMIDSGGDAGTTLQDNGGNGTRLIVNAADFARIRNGDLIQLTNAAGTREITQRVTELDPSINGVLFQQTVTAGGTRINKEWTNPTISPFIGTTNISFIVYRRITYSQVTIAGIPWLMRQVNENEATRLTPGVSRFNLIYAAAPTTGGSLSTFTDLTDFDRFRDIRMVNIEMVCLSDEAITNGSCNYVSANNYTGACVQNGINTDIAIRRYRNRFTSIPG